MARRKRKTSQTQMFTRGEDLPLFSRTPQRQILPPFNPQQAPAIQTSMPGFRWQPTMKEMYDNRSKIIRPSRRRRRRR